MSLPLRVSAQVPRSRAAPPRVQQSALLPWPRGPAAERHHWHRPSRCHAIGSVVSAEWEDDDYIEVGTLSRAHGVKGEVIVGLSTSSPDERFGRPGKRFFIQAPLAQGAFVTRPPEPPRQVHLAAGRKHITKGNQVWLLRFEECPDRDTAETLRNYRVLIPKNERETLVDSDEFYSTDLVGLTVAIVSDHSAVSDSEPSSASEGDDESSPDAALGESGPDESGPDAALDHGGQLAGNAAAGEEPQDSSVAGDGLDEAVLQPLEPVEQLRGLEACEGGAGGAVGGGDESRRREHREGGAAEEEDEEEDAEEDEEEVVVALGRVVDVYDGTGTHGVLRIEFREGLQIMPDGRLVELSEEERRVAEASGQSTVTQATGLLPFARDIVPEVDLEEQLIVVDPPEGWLELYLTPKEKKKKRRYRKRKSPRPLPVAIEA